MNIFGVIKTILCLSISLFLAAGCTSRLERAVGNLQKGDPGDRYLAVGELQKFDKEQAAPYILSALNDEDSRVVRRAIRVLGDRQEVRAIYPLIEKLADRNPSIWVSASNALIKMGLSTVAPLIGILDYKNPELVQRAVTVLGKVGSRQAADPLMKLLRHPSVAVRMSAAAALGHVKVIRSVPALMRALDDKDPRVQYEAARALFQYRPYSIAPLVESLQSSNEDLVINAIALLAKIGTTDAIRELGGLGDHPSGGIRLEAVEGLGKIGNEEAAVLLVAALKDEFTAVCRVAADYLVTMGPAAVGLLVPALEDEDVNLRRNATLVLGKIGDERAILPLIGMLSSPSVIDRQRAASVLGMLGHSWAIAPLINELRSNLGELNWYVTQALIKIGLASAAPLIAVLGDAEPHTRAWANLILLNLGSGVVVPLIEALKTERKAIRQAAENVLLWIGLPAVTPLLNVIEDENPRLRTSAKRILRKMGSRAADTLAKALPLQPIEKQTAIVRLLGEIGDYPAINTLVAALDDERISQEAARALDRLEWKPAHWIDRVRYQLAQKEAAVLLTHWERTYKVLRHNLASGDRNAIEYAVSALMELKGEAMIPQLIQMLKDQENAGTPEGYATSLIKSFAKENPKLDRAVSQALVEIGGGAVQPLIEALGVENAAIKTGAMETLQSMGSDTVGALESALSHPSDSIRRCAAILLGRIGDKRAIASLESGLTDWEIRQQAASALDALGWTPQTPYEQVCYQVAKGYPRELQDEWDQALKTLMRDLRSRREKPTEYAVLALLSINPQMALPELKTLLAQEGDISLAKAYLASGNGPLIIAALEWSIQNGYHEMILN